MLISQISISTMFRYIQHLLFDPGDDPALIQRRRGQPLTPEQRERRRRLREKMLRRQQWVIPDAKPPKKRKAPKRRKRRRSCGMNGHANGYANGHAITAPKRPRSHDPNRVLKRQYKPLASPLFNLPAGLVDVLQTNKINLRKPVDRKRAHKIVDAIARVYVDRDCLDPDEIKDMHDAIERLARNPLPIREQVKDIRAEFAKLAEEVQAGWSEHHRDKQNNYYAPPLMYEPTRVDGLEPQTRDIFE